ncbi:MAG: hypothetical protein NZ585_10830 [Chloracidobacterium sp.]|nr:hypothetical protein [Chloracidobacterium sp.]MDW8217707.1 hypothetical protein [Acidobacteriota bacterium]
MRFGVGAATPVEQFALQVAAEANPPAFVALAACQTVDAIH